MLNKQVLKHEMQNLFPLWQGLDIQLHAAEDISECTTCWDVLLENILPLRYRSWQRNGKYGKIISSLKPSLYCFSEYLVLFKHQLFRGKTVQIGRKVMPKKCFLGNSSVPKTYVLPSAYLEIFSGFDGFKLMRYYYVILN